MQAEAHMPAWDRYDAYLFDVDGTLLNCKDAVHYFAFCETLTVLAGKPMNLDGVIAHGNTDVGILRDALQLAGVEDAAWRPRLAEARERLGSYVAQHKQDMQVEVLPGVMQVLQYLRERGATLGVATGNLRAIGQEKLRRAGLLDYLHFGGYSDLFEKRADVFAAALQHAKSLVGTTARVCVVGDTPSDVHAAHANGLPVVAVCTGIYTSDQLAREGPEYLVASLCELLRPSVTPN